MKCKKLILILLTLITVTLLSAQADSLFLAADQSVMVLPTAYTMPKGNSALTSFELVIIQYSYSLNGRLHLSAGSLFPITREMINSFTAGAKLNYLQYHRTQASVMVSYTPDTTLLSMGNIFSSGIPHGSLHLVTGMLQDFKQDETGILLGIGSIISLSPRISIMNEFIHYDTPSKKNKDGQILLAGIRFRGQKISWDLGGFRPSEMDSGDIIMFPFVKATFMF